MEAEEVRYPYHSPISTLFGDSYELAKWLVRRMWDLHPQQARFPDILKRRLIASYARRNHLRVFVESGTYLGETVAFMRRYCSWVYSVEFQPHLARAAQSRFADDLRIRIVEGNSADWLPRIIAELKEPALFWLDGHFAVGTARNGEIACPTMQELAAVLGDARFSHIVLVDDAREFRGQGGYPTLEALQRLIRELKPDVVVEVVHDIVRITHKSAEAAK
jgi:hypothetical protein